MAWLAYFPAQAEVPSSPSDSARATHLLELYRWADYDSVLALAPELAGDARLPGSWRARIWLCLGVAEFAAGQVAASAGEFLRAQRLDSSQGLDPLYTEKDVMEHYRLTLASEAYLLRNRTDQARRDAMIQIHRQRVTAAFAWIGFAVGALGLGASAYEYEEGDQSYDEMVQAARVTGDATRYGILRREVRVADRRTLAAATIGVGGLIAGCLLWAEARMLGHGRKAPQVAAALGTENMELVWAF